MSRLYVVATPIGNLEDLSPRALRILKEADLILAEDTRVTRGLLTAFSIKTPLESCHQHNEGSKAEQIISRMLESSLQVALVTDAGTPAVSDPGALLIGAANQAGIEVIAVPGPSAFAAALSKSGFEEKEFTFFGFLPRKNKELTQKLRSMQGSASLAVIYESPHRMLDLLNAVGEIYPGCRLSVSRELTKLHEQTLNGTVEEILERFKADAGLLRGEFAVVLQVPPKPLQEPQETGEISAEARLMDLMVQGRTLRDARAELLAGGLRKNTVYAAALNLKRLAQTLLEREG